METMHTERKYLFKDETPEQDFAEFIPTYLANRREDLIVLEESIEKYDYDKINQVCHKILGSAASYGLLRLESLVRKLKESAVSENLTQTQLYIKFFRNYF